MAEFKFFCPRCGRQIQCGTNYSGTQINCPVCQQPIVVPQVQLEAAPAVPQPVAVKSPALQNVLLIVTAVVVLGGLVIGGWYGYTKLKMHKMPPGLIALWSGEGNANDSVGGNNGTLMGSTTFAPGKVGQGFVFDGNNGSGVLLGNPASLQLQDFTIEAWIKRSSASVVSHGSGGNGNLLGCGWGGFDFFMEWNGRLDFDKFGDVYPQYGPFITDTNVHHVALTKAGGTVVFYLDGVAYPVPNYSGTFIFISSIGIGYRPDNGDNSFLGTIDEMGIFNRALSASEIQAIAK